MTPAPTYLSEADHAKLVALQDDRRRLEIRRARAKRRLSRTRMTLAEKLAEDRKYAEELAELNRQIDAIMKKGGETGL